MKKITGRPALNREQYEQTPDELLGPGQLTIGTVHGNVKDRVCHLSECESYFCRHCTIEFKDMEIALQAGFIPCDNCKAILEKQNVSAADKTLP